MAFVIQFQFYLVEKKSNKHFNAFTWNSEKFAHSHMSFKWKKKIDIACILKHVSRAIRFGYINRYGSNQLQNNAHHFRKMHFIILILSHEALCLTMLQHSAFG